MKPMMRNRVYPRGTLLKTRPGQETGWSLPDSEHWVVICRANTAKTQHYVTTPDKYPECAHVHEGNIKELRNRHSLNIYFLNNDRFYVIGSLASNVDNKNQLDLMED